MPTIALGPGVAAGTSSSTPFAQFDFYSTFLGLAGGKVADEIDGISFAELLRGGDGPDANRPLFFHYPHYNRQATPHSAAIAGDMKLLRF